MNEHPLIVDLREFELKISSKLTECEQLELHNLVSCVKMRLDGLAELTNERWERL